VKLLGKNFRIEVKSFDDVRRVFSALIGAMGNINVSGITNDPDIDELPLTEIVDSDFEGKTIEESIVVLADHINKLMTFINGVWEEKILGGGLI